MRVTNGGVLRFSILISTGLLVLVAGTLGSQVASATNWSGASGGTGCNAVNRTFDYYLILQYSSLTSNMTSATNYARTNAIDPTDIDTVLSSSNPDVSLVDADFSAVCGYTWWTSSTSGVVGLATCNSLVLSSCKHHTVYYHQPFTDATTTANRRGLACHEVGHTLGLLHRSGTSCMPQGYPKPALTYEHSHEVLGHINPNY